jgi:hypothetical protein
MLEVLSVQQHSLFSTDIQRVYISRLLSRKELLEMTEAPFKPAFEEVIDGRECYVTRGTFQKPIGGIVKDVLMVFEKATMFLIRSQMRGVYQGLPFIQASYQSYKFLEKPYYPLYVGKECRVVKTETIKTTLLNRMQTQTDTFMYTYKVEKIEDITIRGGTFKCFKVVQYNGNGDPIMTHWEPNRNGGYEVKSVNHETGEIIKIISAVSTESIHLGAKNQTVGAR